MHKIYHYFRQFIILCCLLPASFLRYPAFGAWFRAMRDPRASFKNICANGNDLISASRKNGAFCYWIVGAPLTFARQIREYGGVWRALDWNCGRVLQRMGLLRTSVQAPSEWLLPAGQVSLIPGLVEQRPEAIAKADALLEDLPKTDVSISGNVVCVAGDDAFSGEKVAVVAHWDADGLVDAYVLYMIKHLRSLGWKVVLSSAGALAQTQSDVVALVDGLVYRTCSGYDFTSWKAALECFPSLMGARELLLCNDSVFGGIGSHGPMHEAMDGIACDFWGISETQEVRPHIQSFYLVFRQKALRHPAFAAFMRRVPLSNSRKAAVELETNFSLWLARHGLQPAAFVPVAPSIPKCVNPSCECWKLLIEAGVPIIKRELLFKNDRRVDLSGWVEVLKERKYPLDLVFCYAWRRRFDLTPLLCSGTCTGRWPSDVLSLQRGIDLDSVNLNALPETRPPLGVFVHVFYPHLLPEVSEYLSNLPRTAHVYVSTDTESKAEQVRSVLEPLEFAQLSVRVFPNKGWDIAPFIVGFADEIRKYPIIVRVHAKCSAQIPVETADQWRGMLFSSLLGSEERVRRLEALLSWDTRLGMICPPPVAWYATNVNAAGNLNAMNRLLAPSGITLTQGMAIDFPMGSMFWCRSEVLEPWLRQGLSFDDFDSSDALQRDGSLAHALERVFLFGCGIAGLHWGRVAPVEYNGLVPVPAAHLSMGQAIRNDTGGLSCGYVSSYLQSFKHRLKERLKRVPFAARLWHAFQRRRKILVATGAIPHIPVQSGPRLGADAIIDIAAPKPELVIVLPRVYPLNFSGGPNTALLFAAEVAKHGYGVHCLSESPPTTTTEILRKHLQELLSVEQSVAQQFRVSCMSSRVTLRANDRLMATAWWTVDTAKTLSQRMERNRFIYFIQDFEPLFYPWNEQHAGAMLSYSENFLPVFNESCLAEFCFNLRPGRFEDEAFRQGSLVFTPAVDRIQFYPENRQGKHTLLFYARPTAPRNLYQFGMEAMYRLVQEKRITADRWEIVCMGDDTVRPTILGHDVVTRTAPWLGFTEYAASIRRASVGLSLMLSPHTSYMPLELAAAGVPVVTTAYVNKTGQMLNSLSPAIIGVEATVEAITEGLRQAVARVEAQADRIDELAAPASWPESFGPIMPRVLQFMETGE